MESYNAISEKKKALMRQKERILQEINYYEKRIKDLHNNPVYRYEASSSDSEDDFTSLIDTGPSMKQLKLERGMLKTCLQATQELTGLQILQSETKIIDAPVLVGETSVKEAGRWREVIAECKIDMVPFSIMFYTHTPNRKFAPTWYRGLRVTVIKTSHEAELSKSVLSSVRKPGEAVAVLVSYSKASRSRRNTLAQLADLYETSLFMEPIDDGGFLLKCENTLEMSWRLENKRSPFSPFCHRMTLNLEYMDQIYVNKIRQVNKQLSDPTLSTDERTELLSTIISICLKAKKPATESAVSDLENEKRNSVMEDAIMAPPKTVPRRSKGRTARSTVEGATREVDNDRSSGAGNSKRLAEDTERVDQDSDQHDRDNTTAHRQQSNREESVRSTGHRTKEILQTDVNNGGSSKNPPGKRNRPAESITPVENAVDGNAKRNKINENKNPSDNVKKNDVKTIAKNHKQITKSNTGHKLVENVTQVTNEGVASSSTKNGNLVNKLAKSVNNVKVNEQQQQDNFAAELETNREKIISGSAGNIKRIDSPRQFNGRKPIVSLKIQSNRKSFGKTRRSIGKKSKNGKIEKENRERVSKIPQKLTSHTSGSISNSKFITSSNSNPNTNSRKISNIPRLAKPGTSKQ